MNAQGTKSTTAAGNKSQKGKAPDRPSIPGPKGWVAAHTGADHSSLARSHTTLESGLHAEATSDQRASQLTREILTSCRPQMCII
jgi:hypothetical protein